MVIQLLCLLAVATPSALAVDGVVALNFPIDTLRVGDTWLGLRDVDTLRAQSGNSSRFITADPSLRTVTSQGGMDGADEGNGLNLVQQNLQAIQVINSTIRSRIGGVDNLPERAACSNPRVGQNSSLFQVTASQDSVLRVDCLGGEELILLGMGAKCLSTWLPDFETISVNGSGIQEIIFSPVSGDNLPSLISFEPQLFSDPRNTRLVLEMPRLAHNSTVLVKTSVFEGKLPFAAQEPIVVIRGCNVEQTVTCTVKDVLGNNACAFVNDCHASRDSALAWLEHRRQQGECPMA